MPDGLTADVERLLKDLSDIAYSISARLWVESIEGNHLSLDLGPFGISYHQWDAMRKRAAEAGYTLSIVEGKRKWDSRDGVG